MICQIHMASISKIPKILFHTLKIENTLIEQRFLFKTELMRKKEKGRKVCLCQQPDLS